MAMIIYKTTNLVNGKIYVGQTRKTGVAFKRYMGGGLYLNRAIKKYGKENFKKEILETLYESATQEDLNDRETFWIAKLNSQDLNVGYNLISGGAYNHTDRVGKYTHSEETKQKMRDAAVARIDRVIGQKKIAKKNKNGQRTYKSGHRFSDEHRRNLSEAHKGKVISDETRKKMSEAAQGREVWNTGRSDLPKLSNEHKQKIGNANRGKKRTPEQNAANSERMKGNVPWNKGKKTGPRSEEARQSFAKTEEQRKKISDSLKAYHAKKREHKNEA